MNDSATRKQVEIAIWGPLGSLTFYLLLFVPNSAPKPVPVFLLLNNRDASNTDPSRTHLSDFWPAEEVIARGYAIAAIQNKAITPDNPETFREGVINLFTHPDTSLADTSWGAIAAWAWGGSRAVDYFITDRDIDRHRIAVVGHSRGGKAALVCGSRDERIALTISNCSGCSGATISRRKSGERITDINNRFPHWFNRNYKRYNDNEESLPIDQHELIALMAPRLVYVASASNDAWADPAGEFISCVKASPVFELFGATGIASTQIPACNSSVHDGRIGYHLREGDHKLTSYDWHRFMDFADKHFGKAIA